MDVRLATKEDSLDILKWRNDPLTRSMSFENSFVDKKSHENWYQNVLKNPNNVMVVGFVGEVKVGVVRFTIKKSKIIISINMNAESRGKGLAPILLVASEKFLEKKLGIVNLIAEIKKENIASVKTFFKAGYEFYKKEKRDIGEVNVYKKNVNLHKSTH